MATQQDDIAPEALAPLARGALPERIEAVLRRLDALPRDVVDNFVEDFLLFPDRIVDLRAFGNSLMKFRQSAALTAEDFDYLLDPHEMLAEIAGALCTYQDVEPLPDETQEEILAIAEDIVALTETMPDKPTYDESVGAWASWHMNELDKRDLNLPPAP